MVDAVRFCFPLVAEGTVVEGAELVVEEPEGRASCLACGAEFVQDAPFTPCPCGSRRFRRLTGEELLVTGFELVEAGADAAPAEGGDGSCAGTAAVAREKR